MTRESQSTRWWTEQGPDVCEGCQGAYYTEDGYYCAACDRGICTTCIAFIQDGVLLCEFCHSEQQQAEDSHSKTSQGN